MLQSWCNQYITPVAILRVKEDDGGHKETHHYAAYFKSCRDIKKAKENDGPNKIDIHLDYLKNYLPMFELF